MKYLMILAGSCLVILLVISAPLVSVAAEQFCQVTGKDEVRMGRSNCPSSTRQHAKFLALTKLIRACKFRHRINFKKLIVTTKLLSHEKIVSGGKMIGCSGEWRVCTRCKLSK